MGHYNHVIMFDHIEVVATPSGEKSHPEKLRELADSIEKGEIENYNLTLVSDNIHKQDRITIMNIYGGGNYMLNSKKHYGPITEVHIDSQSHSIDVFNRYSEAIDIDLTIDNTGTSLVSIGPYFDKEFAELEKFNPEDVVF